MITASAASAEAVAPAAPIATPTSASASAGASLTPSPTITDGRRSRARAHDRQLAVGRARRDAVDSELAADRLGDLALVAGGHHDPRTPAARSAAIAARASSRTRSASTRTPAARPSTPTKTRALPRCAAAVAARGDAHAPLAQPRRAADGHAPAVDRPSIPWPGSLAHVRRAG